ncbi:putative phosphorylase b kinase regulatory subunit alpha isoform X3 [Tubulanus polymorphus]|uniref:putative phosphorylase b kinase regulatory subunit alpha isoform X3 n=1 Tax=Tubulanus polymorphus TaxID=672921 RepID=UPI003DA49BA1
MRSRSNSGVRLDYFYRIVNKTILKHQHPVTGLLPATPDHPHAWVRDNVYSILAVWGLALAYKKNADLDEDRAKAYELTQSVVKLMRGLLLSMMKQVDKLEKFKYTQSKEDCLHAKFSVSTGATVVGDTEWGHLQIDATSLYLLQLAQMTASGHQIVYTLDEVSFIQNLVFYIESAYRIPDYGIWERGDKTNHGLPELNASSIGMAKAALEAINELDVFSSRGGPNSVIHVLADEPQQCQAVLQSMLPRESSSKEVDSALLSIISFPAFAVDDEGLIELTRKTIVEKLQGRYGCCRFLRDGYKTAKEDANRLYYEPWELKVFENIECQWPVFFAYFILDGLFFGNKEQVQSYKDLLDKVLIRIEGSGMTFMPELYSVPAEKVNDEYNKPRSQERKAIGKVPHMWGQSLYVLGRLVIEGFLSPGELDPLNRRLVTEPKPDLVVQVFFISVVILAEDASIQEMLMAHGLHVQTFAEVSPIQVHPARVLSYLYSHLGKNEKLGLTGRASHDVGLLSTSKLYMIGNQIYAFLPQFLDPEIYYLSLDIDFLIDLFRTDVASLKRDWNMLGRPLLIIPVMSWYFDFKDTNKELQPALVATIQKLRSGYINGTRVQLGNLMEFISTSCVTKLTFLPGLDSVEGIRIMQTINRMGPSISRARLPTNSPKSPTSSWHRLSNSIRKQSIAGIVKRTRSIAIDGEEDFATHYLKGSLNPAVSGAVPVSTNSPTIRRHTSSTSDKDDRSKYDGIDCQELVDSLKTTEDLQEQADIIYYLFITKGPSWDTLIGGKAGCTVKDLMKELYEKAGHLKQWWLVRHTAGMLHKRVEDLAKAVTDLIVRQKQVTVGLPPEPREKVILRPLPPDELATIIHDACGEDCSTAMFTQELLVYLAMFIRTEPNLFNEMLRLRVGLIIQVMACELARTLKCSGEEASEHLLNLSPYETKTLLHHILSGKEFGIQSVKCRITGQRRLSIQSEIETQISDRSYKTFRNSVVKGKSELNEFKQSTLNTEFNISPSYTSRHRRQSVSSDGSETEADLPFIDDRTGQWLRRRRLDGALNRVPVGFYPRVWHALERCHGLSVAGHIIQQGMTREMTQGELKFALQVELVLNHIPQPEYRQLNVEAMMVLGLLLENDGGVLSLNYVVPIDKLVSEANLLFLKEQVDCNGDAVLCCASQNNRRSSHPLCGGSAGICYHFFDSAPSGRYGTMTYLFRAIAHHIQFPMKDEDCLDCVIS